VSSWDAAVRSRAAQVAVLAVVMQDDRPAAVAVAERLLTLDPAPIVCTGGAAGHQISAGLHSLAPGIGEAAEQLDELVHAAVGLGH